MIILTLFGYYNSYRNILINSQNSISSYINKIQGIAMFNTGPAGYGYGTSNSVRGRVSEIECIQWLLLNPNSSLPVNTHSNNASNNGKIELPLVVLQKINRPNINEHWRELGKNLRNVKQILKSTYNAYGNLWYLNTLTRIRGTPASSKNCDLGLILLLLCIKDAITDYNYCRGIIVACAEVSKNGYYFHATTTSTATSTATATATATAATDVDDAINTDNDNVNILILITISKSNSSLIMGQERPHFSK